MEVKSVFCCYSVKLISFLEEMNDSEPDLSLKPENGENYCQDKKGAQGHLVLAEEVIRMQGTVIDGGQDAKDQISHEDNAPNEDAGEGFGLLREQGGENTGIGPVLLVGIGIPCHKGTSHFRLVVATEFLPEEKFQKGEEQPKNQVFGQGGLLEGSAGQISVDVTIGDGDCIDVGTVNLTGGGVLS